MRGGEWTTVVKNNKKTPHEGLGHRAVLVTSSPHYLVLSFGAVAGGGGSRQELTTYLGPKRRRTLFGPFGLLLALVSFRWCGKRDGGGCRRLENLIYSVLLSFARSRLPIITIPTEHADKSQVRIGLDTHYRYAVSSLSCDRREEIMFTIIHAHELYHYHHNWKASVWQAFQLVHMS